MKRKIEDILLELLFAISAYFAGIFFAISILPSEEAYALISVLIGIIFGFLGIKLARKIK